MPDATITSTASTFGTIAGTFAADQSTITGTITAITGTVDGSVGVPGPQGPAGAAGVGVPAAGTTGQVLQKLSATSYDTGWLTLGTMAAQTASDYSTTAVANGLYYPLSGNPSGFLTASALTPYLEKAGGYITGDIISSNGSGLYSSNGASTYCNVSASGIAISGGSGPGSGALSINWDGISFVTSPYKQTQPFLGLSGYATEAWVTAGFYPLSGNPSGFLTDAPSDGSQYARKNAAWDVVIPGDRYLTTSTTSNTLSNTTKTFTIGTGLSYTPTQNLTISYDASNHMHGEVLTYNSGTGVLTVDIKNHTGSGTYAAWVVNVGGVTPATSVAWGAITGTLSTQTDLQNALDLKLDVTTAASTYYLQTNPAGFIDASALTGYATETFVTTQGYITQGTADGLYYPLSGNPSGFLTAGNLAPYAELAGAAFTGPVSTSDTVTVGSFNPDPTPTANGQMWFNALLGRLRFYDGVSTKSVASEAWASAAFYPLSGNPSAFLVAADITGKADLASPTFTGTPTLPTGTIATTQSPGNNTTALATTAFVTAAVPAFATQTQARDSANSSTTLSPKNAIWQHMSAAFFEVARAGFQYTAAGTMGAVTSGWMGTRITLGTAGACSGRTRVFGGSQIDQSYSMMSKTTLYGINFSKPTYCSGRAWPDSTITDPNVTVGWYFGKAENSGAGDLSRRGFGWEIIGNATTRYLTLAVHNGTTLTKVTSSYVVTNGTIFDWDVVSDGAGNVTLYVEGVSVATSALGPTGDINYSGTRPVIWQEEVRTTAATSAFSFVFSRCRIYMGL